MLKSITGRLFAFFTVLLAAVVDTTGPCRGISGKNDQNRRSLSRRRPDRRCRPTDCAIALPPGSARAWWSKITPAPAADRRQDRRRRAADGYTLLLGGTNVNSIAGAIYKDFGFDPIASFAPIAAICVDSMALAVSPNVPADTVTQLVKYAKDNPGKLKYGAPPGIYTHFAGEFFKIKTGTDILFVPYKGGAPAITDVLGGHIDMVFNNRSTLLPQFKDGKLKALAVTSAARWPELPQTPTMTEAGITGFPLGDPVRVAGAGRNAGGYRRATQPRHQRRPADGGGPRQPGWRRRRGKDWNPAGICRGAGRTGARMENGDRCDRCQIE